MKALRSIERRALLADPVLWASGALRFALFLATGRSWREIERGALGSFKMGLWVTAVSVCILLIPVIAVTSVVVIPLIGAFAIVIVVLRSLTPQGDVKVPRKAELANAKKLNWRSKKPKGEPVLPNGLYGSVFLAAAFGVFVSEICFRLYASVDFPRLLLAFAMLYCVPLLVGAMLTYGPFAQTRRLPREEP